jgi:hypothetical protein
MHSALEGALVGCGIAIFLVAAEYYFVVKGAKERAVRKHLGHHEIDPNERKRLRAIVGFCAFLPPVFAFFYWLIWR